MSAPKLVDPESSCIRCSGDFDSWKAALSASTGYYLPAFVERTTEAARAVRDGEAAYERDSVLFDRIQNCFPLLTGLLWAAVASGGRLCVLDFGGSLGSSYRQCRRFLAPLSELRWMIVDQPQQVEIGRREFETDELRFFPSAVDALAWRRADLLLLSGVLPCIPDPYGLLDDLLAHLICSVVVDRTFFLARDADRLTVQHGPLEIYPGSYPAWFLSESRLLSVAARHGYELLADFEGFDCVAPEDEAAYSKGFILGLRGRTPAKG